MQKPEKLKHYLKCYENKDLESISSLFSEDITLRDWKISVSGYENALAETRKNFKNAESLSISILNIMESEDSVSAELKIVVNNEEVLSVVDVLTFNDKGLISSIRAYLGREDLTYKTDLMHQAVFNKLYRYRVIYNAKTTR
ncbi:nuclear transport factor 2 family protein [Alteromonas gracilis]|uniref:nuclear transport factor 2 family protein n=1 Tax=Alteromonas gracilis TaxID=1479524 RepID=UPI0037362D20